MEPDVVSVPATSLLGVIHSCRKIAGGTRQDQTLAGIKEFPAVVREIEFRLRWISFFFRKGSPCFETLVHQLESLVRLQGILSGEEFAGGTEDVEALPGATDRSATTGNLLAEELAFPIGVSLQAPDLIGSGYEVAGFFDHPGVIPDGPPARHTVASRTAEGMSIHQPQQHRFALEP